MPEKIIVIGEDAQWRERVASGLRAEQYPTVILSSDEKIQETVRAENPDLLIWEIAGYPGSFSKLEQVIHKRPSLAVLVCLDAVSMEAEKGGFAAGAKEVLDKQAGIEEIKIVIQRIFASAQKKNPAADRKTQPKIMIVDDEPDIRMVLDDFFQSQGFATLTAHSGEEAVRLAAQERPRLILMDVMMPGRMNGIEALKQIKQLDPSVSVIMATGVGDQAVTKEATRNGAYHYVLKPFDLNYLELVVLTRLNLAI